MITRMIPLAPVRSIFPRGAWLMGLSLGSAAVLQAQTLTGHDLMDLGTFSAGGASVAADIDSSGKVVGYSQVQATLFLPHAFLFSAGALTDLGVPGSRSMAYGINNSGDIVGEGRNVPNAANTPSRAFLYTGGAMTDIGTLGGAHSFAAAINASGQVVGASEVTTSGSDHAYLYVTGLMTNLGTLPGGNYSQAWDINDKGQVAGFSNNGNGRRHAFLWERGTMTDLGTLGGPNFESQGHGINASGQVVGFSQYVGSMGYHHACLFSGGTITDLGTLGGDESEAYALNDVGLIVGASDLNGHTVRHAFAYWHGTMYDLNTALAPLLSNGSTPGFTSLTMAHAVNNDWQVVGMGAYFDGVTHYPQRAFRVSLALVPPRPPPSWWTQYGPWVAVVVVAALVVGLLVVGARRRP